MDSYGRLCWGLIQYEGHTLYYEQTTGSGFKVKEFGVPGPWHPVSESMNRPVWEAVQADISAHADKQLY